MTIVIDEALWPFRGKRWCHLTSDSSLDELHRFAESVGLPPRAFHGDHYDIPEDYRHKMIAAGAREVTARELVRSMRVAGIRVSPAQRRAAAIPDQAGGGTIGTAEKAIRSNSRP